MASDGLFLAFSAGMEKPAPFSRQALQDLFARASARRAERRRFIETLRQIVEQHLTPETLPVLKLDRRQVPREA
jgi:hypothetical protein